MNALNPALSSFDRIAPSPPQFFGSSKGQSRPQPRARDFGVGYGRSSGYASPRRYIADHGPRLFRLQ